LVVAIALQEELADHRHWRVAIEMRMGIKTDERAYTEGAMNDKGSCL
jgi:hypothetical protein